MINNVHAHRRAILAGVGALVALVAIAAPAYATGGDWTPRPRPSLSPYTPSIGPTAGGPTTPAASPPTPSNAVTPGPSPSATPIVTASMTQPPRC